jgi:hypothetical protein
MWNIIKLKNPVWYIDATGGVHQKINGQKEIFIYRTVCHDENQKKIIPVFDFLIFYRNKRNSLQMNWLAIYIMMFLLNISNTMMTKEL